MSSSSPARLSISSLSSSDLQLVSSYLWCSDIIAFFRCSRFLAAVPRSVPINLNSGVSSGFFGPTGFQVISLAQFTAFRFMFAGLRLQQESNNEVDSLVLSSASAEAGESHLINIASVPRCFSSLRDVAVTLASKPFDLRWLVNRLIFIAPELRSIAFNWQFGTEVTIRTDPEVRDLLAEENWVDLGYSPFSVGAGSFNLCLPLSVSELVNTDQIVVSDEWKKLKANLPKFQYLKKLHFSNAFNAPNLTLEPGMLPSSLTELGINRYRDPLKPGDIPQTVEILNLQSSVDVNTNCLPSSLKQFTLRSASLVGEPLSETVDFTKSQW